MQATRLRRRIVKNESFSAFLRRITVYGVYFLLGVLVSKGAVFGTLAPFGVAFAAAVPIEYMGFAVAGSSLGYILLSPLDSFRYIAVIAAIGVLRWLLGDIKKISGSRLFIPFVAFLPMLATGAAMLFVSTSRLSDLTTCIIEAVISAVGAYFLARTSALFSSARSIGTFSQQEMACLAVSFCILMLSLSSVAVLGISVGRVLAVLAVLLCAKYGSVYLSSVTGIATGVVFSLGSTDMAFVAGGYAFGGLVSGIFSNVGKLPVGMAFTVCSSLFSFASKDYKLILSMFIESLLATGLFMLIPQSAGKTVQTVFSFSKRERTDSDLLRSSVTTRLEHTAKALEGVSDCVSAVSEKLQNSCGTDLQLVISQQVIAKTCKSCGLRAYCWQKMKEVTTDDLKRLCDELHSDGFVTEKTVDERFSKKCCKQAELAKSVNASYKEYISALSAKRRISQVRSVVAGQFSGLKTMLSDLSEEFENYIRFDSELADDITAMLRETGVIVTDCSVMLDTLGKTTVELSFLRNRRVDSDAGEIHRIVTKCCSRRFDLPTVSSEGDRIHMVMSEMSLYDVDIGTSQHIAGNGNLCGDCLDYFLNGRGSMVAVISDGMGTGGAAAVDSNMAVSILTRLLKAGLSYDGALSVVNSSLMIKSEDESMATVDVADINLYTGKVSILKAGAPATYIRRGGRVHRRDTTSLPVGILSEARFMKDTVTLHEDDTLLMLSDGALMTDEEWIAELMKSWHDASAQDFASIVVNEAIKRRKGEHDDDITAIAVRLLRNEISV